MYRIVPVLSVFALTACHVRGTYIPTTNAQRLPTVVNTVHVFYGEQPIPTGYIEIGRIFLRVGANGARDPGGQIQFIRNEAAANGADAVIVIETKSQAEYYSAGGIVTPTGAGGASARGRAQEEIRYYGIALSKIR